MACGEDHGESRFPKVTSFEQKMINVKCSADMERLERKKKKKQQPKEHCDHECVCLGYISGCTLGDIKTGNPCTHEKEICPYDTRTTHTSAGAQRIDGDRNICKVLLELSRRINKYDLIEVQAIGFRVKVNEEIIKMMDEEIALLQAGEQHE